MMNGRRSWLAKVVSHGDLLKGIERSRRAGRRIVFANGCFDLLHVGHVTHLEQAAEMGDVFVVAINSDASIRQLKGPSRPIVGQCDRARMVAALECVDFVVIFDEPTPIRLLETVRPDVLVKGGAYSRDEIVGRDVVDAYGGEVRTTTHRDGVSTTVLLRAIREAASAACGVGVPPASPSACGVGVPPASPSACGVGVPPASPLQPVPPTVHPHYNLFCHSQGESHVDMR